MQMSIQVPDNLPLQRINQRIRELEESLKAEAKLINELNQHQTNAHQPHPVGRVYYSGRQDVSQQAKKLLFQDKLQTIRERRS